MNFQVLNDTYRKILQASLPGVHAEDVVFTWSVIRSVAQQIIYDPQKMVERGAVPFVASELKYGGMRARPPVQQSLGSVDLSASPGTEGFTSMSDVGFQFEVDPADAAMGPPITPTQMGAALSGAFRTLAGPGPSQPPRTHLTGLAESLGQNRREARNEPQAAPPSTGTPGDRNSSATLLEPTSPATSTPMSTVTTLSVVTPTIPVAVDVSAPTTPGDVSTTRSQSSHTSSVGKKRKKTYAAMSTGGPAPRNLSTRPPETRESLRAGLRPRSQRQHSLALSSDESASESEEELLPKGKKSKSRRGSPEIAKKAANEAAKKAAPRPRETASAQRAQRESADTEEQSARRSESRLGPMDLEYDSPEKADYTKGTTEFYSVDWDALMEQFTFYRKRKDSVLFGGTAELKERCAAVDQYTERLPDRKAHQLRAVVEVAVQCQFPARAFVVGLDPRVLKRERQPTPEETAAYNWIRRIVSNDEAPWDPKAVARLHAKLMRLLTEKARWTAADLIHRCRKQIPELGSQLTVADGYGDTRATVIAGPACGASILLGLLSDIDEQIRGPSPDSFDHVDLMPGSRAQLTSSAMALLTPSIDLFDLFLVALDPGNVHRRHAERRPLPEAQPSDPAAELMRYLGPPENYRYDDLEFAAPIEWRTKLIDEVQITVLRGAPGSWHRAFPHGRTPAWINFAGFAPGLDYGGENEATHGSVRAMLENLQAEYRRYRREPEAELPSTPQSVSSSRVINLKHSPFVFADLLALPCIVVEQCTRRSEFGCGPSRDDFSPEHIVVVAFSVYYRSARNEYAGGGTNTMVPAVSEILLSDINGRVLSYMGRGITEEEDVITLDNERWHYIEDNASEEDMRLELIRYRGNNCFIVGWNLGLLFTALGIVVPEWTVLDLAADPYLREYCHDAVLQRGLPGELFNRNIWYTIDRRLFAILATPPDDQRGPIELWSTRGLDDVLRRDVTREVLFSSAVMRHFFRPFQRRYRERYFDTAYKQMVCGWGSTLKALASTDGHIREAIQSAGKGTAEGQGETPATLDEMVARFDTGRGVTAGWREDRSLAEFLHRMREWKMVEHGLSDDPRKVPIYRRADTIPRSSHICEAARVRYPSRMLNTVDVRFYLGWQQSVSKSSVGELVKRVDQEFQGAWDAAELWLVGSYAGFADGTFEVSETVQANVFKLQGEDPPPSLEEEGIEIVEPEDPVEPPPKETSAKKAASKKTASKPKRTAETTTASKTASSSASSAAKKRDTSKPPIVLRVASVPKEKAPKEGGKRVVGAKSSSAAGPQATSVPSTTSKEGMWTQTPDPAPSGKEKTGAASEVFDLTRAESEEGEAPLVVVETVSAPTSQQATPVATQAEAAGRSPAQAERQAMDVDGTPPLPQIDTLILASQHIERQQAAPTEGGAEGESATAGAALHEHDYARAEGEARRDSGSDEEDPQPTPETRPSTSASAEDVAARERESSGEYVDAPTGSQPAAPRADASTERPP